MKYIIQPPINIDLQSASALLNRAKSCGLSEGDYIAFCIDRTLRTTVDDLQIELQKFKEKIK